LLVVIDLTVEYYPEGFVFIGDGLMTAGEIDDRKPSLAKGSAVSSISAFIIRPAMAKCMKHALDRI
jgi:hypothetical protein